ncbi:MAG TPA: type II toxin-antitoxin system HicB family antitoxin [Dehalococcoidia bacterium]|jgi:predicted RNase H-like HicB family nuclease|nr:type II toxin-antitoxin system HicB family antitoxin [Dehalococcoidia bacterium]
MVKREIVERFEVVVEPDEDGGFHIFAPALKGCHSWGGTREEALDHFKEAIALWLESAEEQGIPIAQP